MPEEVELTKDPDHSPMPWKADRDDPVWLEGGNKQSQEPGSFYSSGGQRHIWVGDDTGIPVALVICDEDDEEALANVHLIEWAPALLSIVEGAIPHLAHLVDLLKNSGDVLTAEEEGLVALLEDAHRISVFARRGAP